MKRCDYCGQENEASALACSRCGTSEFVEKIPPGNLSQEPSASPPPFLATAVRADQKLVIEGGFRLVERDTGCRSGYRPVATSAGGAKKGILVISREGITLGQRLGFGSCFLLFLLGLLPAGLLAVAGGFLLMGLFKLGAETFDRNVAMLTLLLAPVLPILTARRTRKFQRRFSIQELGRVQVRGPDLEFDFRDTGRGPELPALSASAHGKPASAGPGSLRDAGASGVWPAEETRGSSQSAGANGGWTHQLMVRPAGGAERGRALVTRLAALSPAVEIRLDDPEEKEKAEFAKRLDAVALHSRAWATPVILALNVLVFIAMANTSRSAQDLVAWGANWGPLTTSGQWARLLSCCFLHWNFGHLAGNMYALLMWGMLAERLFGKGFYLAIYAGCGVTASLASLCWHPLVISAGASGAVFGVCGALLGYLARQRGQVPRSVLGPLLKGSMGFVVANLFTGLANSGIDQAAHVGGLVSGLLFGWVGARPLDLELRKALTGRQLVQLAICLSGVVGGLVAWAPKSLPDYGPALNGFGVAFASGKGTRQDEAAALGWYRKAAELGCADAEFNLGNAYHNGRGVRIDSDAALRWWRLAAEHGNSTAQGLLGALYYQGQGAPQDYAEALKWIHKAAEAGVAAEQFLLGTMYAAGQGTDQNFDEAVAWVRKAADQNMPNAQFWLALAYYRGEGVTRDYTQAAKWSRAAANRGIVEAQVLIGSLCADGQGMTKDKVEAYAWLSLAAGSATKAASGATRGLEILKKEMSPEELDKAKRRTQQLRSVAGPQKSF